MKIGGRLIFIISLNGSFLTPVISTMTFFYLLYVDKVLAAVAVSYISSIYNISFKG